MGLKISGERLSKTKRLGDRGKKKKSEERSSQTSDKLENTKKKNIQWKKWPHKNRSLPGTEVTSPSQWTFIWEAGCDQRKPHQCKISKSQRPISSMYCRKLKKQNPQNPNDTGEHIKRAGRQKQQTKVFKIPKREDSSYLNIIPHWTINSMWG